MSKLDRFLIIAWIISISIGLRYVIGEPQAFGNLQFLEYLRYSVPLSILVSILILARFSAYLLSNHKIRLSLGITIILIALIGIQSLFTERIDLSLYWLLLITIYLLSSLSLLSFFRKNQKAFIFFLIAFSLATGIQAIVGIIQFSIGSTLGLKLLGEITANDHTLGVAKVVINGTKLLRPVGFFPHANIFAGYLVLGVLSIIALIKQLDLSPTRLHKKIETIIPIVLSLQFLGILISFSRSAWISLAILLILSTLTCHSFRGFVKLPLIIVIIAAILGFPGIKSRFIVSEQASQLTIREDVNRYAIELIKENPFFGVGLRQPVYRRSQSIGLLPHEIQPAHNSFIHLTAELGIVTTASLIILLITLLFRTRVKNRSFVIIGMTTLAPILLFDHYLVSISYGLSFLAVMIIILGSDFPISSRQKSK